MAIPKFYTVDETCESLVISRSTFYRLVAEHGIKSFKPGRRRLLLEKEVQKLAAKLQRA